MSTAGSLFDRELDPVCRTIRDRVEEFLAGQRFRLESESLSYGSFASANVKYVRGPLGCPNFLIDLEWDGKDRNAWITYITFPVASPGSPARKNLEARPGDVSKHRPSLSTVEQGEQRARELIDRLAELLKEVKRSRRREKR